MIIVIFYVSPQDAQVDRRGASEEKGTPHLPSIFRVVDIGGILTFAVVFVAFNAAYWLDVLNERQSMED